MIIKWVVSKINVSITSFCVFNVELDLNKYNLPFWSTIKNWKYIKCIYYWDDKTIEEWSTVRLDWYFEGIDSKYQNQFNKQTLQFRIQEIDITSGIDTPIWLKFFLKAYIPHIWETTAKLLVDAKWLELIEIFDKDLNEVIEILTEFRWLWRKKISKMKKWWDEKKVFREILTFLSLTCELSINLSHKTYHEFWENTVDIIKENPYKLTEIKWVWFKRADDLAIRLWIDPKSYERYASLVEFCLLQSIDNGDSIVYIENIKQGVIDYLLNENNFVSSDTDEILEVWIWKAIENEKIVKLNEQIYILKSFYNLEKYISEFFTSRKEIKTEYKFDLLKSESIKNLTSEQKKWVENCLNNNISLLLWPAWSWKTYTTKVLTEILKYSKVLFTIVCPTNSAVKRVKDINWEGIEAYTIDKLIWLRPWIEPEYNENNKLKYWYILIDESSMVDERKLYFLLKAIPNNCSLVLIWDPNQLPPVDVWSPFYDLIKSEILIDNTILLTKVKRQSWESEYEEFEKGINNIVYNSSKILDSKMPINNDKDTVFRYFDNLWSSENIQNKVFEILFKNMKYLQGLWVDLIKDWQILVPTYKGTTGIININNEISKYLLWHSRVFNIRWREFRQWDKIVYQGSPYEWLVKGDLGIVVDYNNLDKELIIDFFWIWIKNLGLDRVIDISLWYAMSIHRSQWNEWKFCTMILTFWAFQLLNKELVYTWFTRAKKRVFVFWESKALSMAIKKSIWQKNTYLFNHLRGIKDEDIKILIDRETNIITDNERKFAQKQLNIIYKQEDNRLLKIKTNQKHWFRYIYWDSKYMHSIWLTEMVFLNDEEFNRIKGNSKLIILNIIKNNLWEKVTNENITKLITKRNKELVENNDNYNIWIIDGLGKKYFYNKTKVKF